MKKKLLSFAVYFVTFLSSLSVFADENGRNMYRLYNPNSGEHFYTGNEEEVTSLTDLGWMYEGVGWLSPAEGQDVYRLYSPGSGDHHYTLDAAERDALVKIGWQYEGVSWKSAGDYPLYRFYNPNAKQAGSHHYSMNAAEKDNLIKKGWKYEGLAWSAIGSEAEVISLPEPIENGTKEDVLRLASSMIGVRGGTFEHSKLVREYNSVLPRPIHYKAKYKDDWCDIFLTVIFQRAGLTNLIGRECGVDRHIQIFKQLGIWNEDGTITPKVGDIITFDWDKTGQPNDEFADHIGLVERVENGIIYTIEGNSHNEVKRKSYPIGQGNIRGFASPQYDGLEGR